MDLLADHFSVGRNLGTMSNSLLRYDKNSEGSSSILIRPSTVITQVDVEDKKPIIAISYDKARDVVMGFEQGIVSFDPQHASSIRVKMRVVPIYINCICASEIQSDQLANYVHTVLEIERMTLLEKPGYQEALFQNLGDPHIIRFVGVGNATYSTPIAGQVTLLMAYEDTMKAETMTQISAFINGTNVMNGGPTDE